MGEDFGSSASLSSRGTGTAVAQRGGMWSLGGQWPGARPGGRFTGRHCLPSLTTAPSMQVKEGKIFEDVTSGVSQLAAKVGRAPLAV